MPGHPAEIVTVKNLNSSKDSELSDTDMRSKREERDRPLERRIPASENGGQISTRSSASVDCAPRQCGSSSGSLSPPCSSCSSPAASLASPPQQPPPPEAPPLPHGTMSRGSWDTNSSTTDRPNEVGPPPAPGRWKGRPAALFGCREYYQNLVGPTCRPRSRLTRPNPLHLCHQRANHRALLRCNTQTGLAGIQLFLVMPLSIYMYMLYISNSI